MIHIIRIYEWAGQPLKNLTKCIWDTNQFGHISRYTGLSLCKDPNASRLRSPWGFRGNQYKHNYMHLHHTKSK
jgi:hypothetical protein